MKIHSKLKAGARNGCTIPPDPEPRPTPGHPLP